ncbi:MAG: nucleotidyltransferase domain-containing protein [Fibromonadaceae bacterium]|jgi:predicted nucleotidyltransferase|nr:nucleotidyltransferase domain-containing protein [Fibromonadaceae bacterium]
MSLSADIISKIVQSLMGLNIYKVILFGSYAKGTATEDSDIDLVIILDTEEFAKTFKNRRNRNLSVSTALLEINRQYAMDIVVYSKGEFEYLDKKESDFVREVKNMGIEIYAKA